LQRIVVSELPRPPMGCHAVAAGGFVFVGGLLPSDFRTGLAPQARPASELPLVDDGLRSQSEYIVDVAETILEAAGVSFADVVRIDQFITERRAAAPYLRARRNAFPLARRPASSLLHVQGLPVPQACVSAEIIAADRSVTKAEIFSDTAPVNFPGAPHGRRASPFVFVQGQIASDFTGPVAPSAVPTPFWYETTVERETEYVLNVLTRILEAAGSSLRNVVKAHVYLTDLGDFCEFERVWAKRFPADRPARTIVPVVSLGSPACHVEIAVIALTENNSCRHLPKLGTAAPDAVPDPDAVLAGDFLFMSGLAAGDLNSGLDPAVKVPPGVRFLASEIERQTTNILERARRICERGGTSLDRLTSAQVYLRDASDYYNFARAWNDALGDDQPVVTTILTPDVTLCPGMRVSVDLVAYAPATRGQ
jgi:enamine deaminase RidA (YjgF/YER057c/UK114 family)